jgi:hypothetical protein
MKFENFSDTRDTTKEDMDAVKDREFNEKIKRRGSLSANEKQVLLKEMKERNFGAGLPIEATQEEVGIANELKDKSEAQPTPKSIDDAGEGLDKELDEELNKYFSHQQQQEKAILDRGMDNIMEKLNNLEGDGERPSQVKAELAKTQQEKRQIVIDNIAERKKTLEQIKKLGESSGIDISDSLQDIQEEIKELEKQIE